MSHKRSHYRELKNHMHNTLDITKEDVRQWTEEAVERIVERKVEVYLDSKLGSNWSIQRLIDDAIRDRADSYWWGESETKLDDYIKTEVVKALLKTVKMKVDLVKTNKEATPATKMRVISRKGVKK